MLDAAMRAGDAMKIRMKLGIVVVSAWAVAVAPGCIVYADSDAAVVVGYEPPHYQGHVVYFDDDGVPVYYVGPTIYVVPTTSVHYRVLVGHYRSHRVEYFRWYREQGHRHVPPQHRHRHRP
jgi:hypothetical protein